MLNVKVAVRIRPFSEREINQKDDFVVQKRGDSVIITTPKMYRRRDGGGRRRTHKFLVDCCFDHKDPENSSQEAVYREIGVEIIKSMFGGYNACILAYGHSASGKTYTMMGIPTDPGLTPRICHGLFETLNLKTKIQYEVSVSFLEIYNEKVRDLLNGDEEGGGSCNFSLRVREHPKLGPYVQGLSQHVVTEKSKLLELLNFGNRRRITAATENNNHSSRSHAVFTLSFKQTHHNEYQIDKCSKVHLVDLAGSERANSGQSKARLKEGANINKSLVTLGNVISALAENYGTSLSGKEHSPAKTWQPFVPYRDSVLTWLLKDTLGGNSHTVMIATVSPASSCFNETLNTLRYAKRTKKIVNRPIMNEDPKSRIIRKLREEISRLRSLLRSERERNLSETEDNLESCRMRSVSDSESNENSSCYGGRRGNHFGLNNMGKYFFKGENKEQKMNSTSQNGTLEKETRVISDEKEPGVNGSVIEILRDTPMFSDSLESLPSASLSLDAPLKTDPRIFVDKISMNDTNFGEIKADEDKEGVSTSENKICRPCEQIDSDSRETHAKKNPPLSLMYKNRPDLIKNIVSQIKEGVHSKAGQSCSDNVSLSKSNSENSLNSSGSIDAPSSSNSKTDTRKNSKKKEIVDAVISRLYVSKHNANDRRDSLPSLKSFGGKKEPEEMNLCKRAKLRLFEAHKPGTTRKFKRMVDSDTQTDFVTKTVRVKEQSVITEMSGISPSFGPNATEPGAPRSGLDSHLIVPILASWSNEEPIYLEHKATSDQAESKGMIHSEENKDGDGNCLKGELSHRDNGTYSDDSLDAKENMSEGVSEKGKKKETTRPRFTIMHSSKNVNIVKLECDSFVVDNRSKRATLKSLSNFDREEPEDDGVDRVVPENFDSEKTEGTREDERDKPPAQSSAVTDRGLYTIREQGEIGDLGESSDQKRNANWLLRMSKEQSPAVERDEVAEKEQKQEQNNLRLSTADLSCGSLLQFSYNNNNNITNNSSPDAQNGSFPGRHVAILEPVWDVIEDKTGEHVPIRTLDTHLPFQAQENNSEFHLYSGSEDVVGRERKQVSCEPVLEAVQRNLERKSFKPEIRLSQASSTPSAGFGLESYACFPAGSIHRGQSSESVFGSDDSVTLVFLGPKIPEVSVLADVIKKSLQDEISKTSLGGEKGRGKERTREKMRSLSVDTALAALSRIGKRSPEELATRATSLCDLGKREFGCSVGGTGKLPSYQENGCQCNLDSESENSTDRKFLRYSVSTTTSKDQQTDTANIGLSEEANVRCCRCSSDGSKTEFDDENQTCLKRNILGGESSNERSRSRNSTKKRNESINTHSRRVRFSQAETPNCKDDELCTQNQNSNFAISTFVKEAINLLRNISYCKGNSDLESRPRKWPKQKKKSTATRRLRKRNDGISNELVKVNDRCLRSRLIDDEYDVLKNSMQSHFGKTRMRTSELCYVRSNNNVTKFSSPAASSNAEDIDENSFAFSYPLKSENSSRRLPSVTESDKTRRKPVQKRLSWDNKGEESEHFENFEDTSCILGSSTISNGNDAARNFQQKTKEKLARRRMEACVGECGCRNSRNDRGGCTWLKAIRSTFELNTFGPGSNHCASFCTFCRATNLELYCSSPSLNSECAADRCRLHFYGHCPCSGVKLRYVSPSPRAYMQHLLTFRRRVVDVPAS